MDINKLSISNLTFMLHTGNLDTVTRNEITYRLNELLKYLELPLKEQILAIDMIAIRERGTNINDYLINPKVSAQLYFDMYLNYEKYNNKLLFSEKLFFNKNPKLIAYIRNLFEHEITNLMIRSKIEGTDKDRLLHVMNILLHETNNPKILDCKNDIFKDLLQFKMLDPFIEKIVDNNEIIKNAEAEFDIRADSLKMIWDLSRINVLSYINDILFTEYFENKAEVIFMNREYARLKLQRKRIFKSVQEGNDIDYTKIL